jgi:hypothetical protein
MKEAGMMTGSTKSTAKSAPMDSSGGNLGKPIGDTGKKCPKGNPKTRGAADRYK